MPATLPFQAPMPSADPTVGELIRLYLSLEAKVETRRAVRSWREAERVLKRFSAAFGHLRVSECGKGQLRIWIEGNQSLRSDWTRGRWCRTVQRAFNWAVEEMDLIPRNPFKGVRYRKGKRGRPLSEEEFAALYGAADRWFKPVLQFCRLTGARPGEMASAKWSDLHLDEQTRLAWISLAEHKTSHREDSKPRIIALPPAIVDLLIALRERLNDYLPGLEPEHIFRNSKGQPWTRNAIGLRMARLKKRTNLPADAKLYGCRHAFATGAIRAGVAIKDLADLMGHASTQMTEHYLHTEGDHARLAELAGKAVGALAPCDERPASSQPADPAAR